MIFVGFENRCRMTCNQLPFLPETFNAADSNFLSWDIGQLCQYITHNDLRDVLTGGDPVPPNLLKGAKATLVVANAAMVVNDLMEVAHDFNQPLEGKFGLSQFGQVAGRAGNILSLVSDVTGTAAIGFAVVPTPATEVIAASLEVISTATWAGASILQVASGIVKDYEDGRYPECPPKSFFPSTTFLDPPISPLALDLDGDGLELTALHGSLVHFDLDASGSRELTGWVKSDDGFLAYDANGDGVINTGQELFGNNVNNGFDVLKFYDGRTGGNFYTNPTGGTVDPLKHDNAITSADPIYANLKIWRDLNQDGVSQSTELFSLSSLGITSINLNYTSDPTQVFEHTIGQQSTFVMSGVSRAIDDVWFATDRSDTIYDYAPTAVASVSAYPDLHARGAIEPLQLAMTENAGLLDKVNAFIADADGLSLQGLLARFQEVMFTWAGVDGVSANSRGDYVDARIIGFLEAAHDQAYLQEYGINEGTPNPGPIAAAALEEVFSHASANMLLKFLIQLPGYNLSQYVSTGDYISTKFDMLFSSSIYDPESDSLYFDATGLARAMEGLDLTDVAAVAAARDIFGLVTLVQEQFEVSSEDFFTAIRDALTAQGATEAIPFVDSYLFYDGNAADKVGDTDLAAYNFSESPYTIVGSGASILEGGNGEFFFVQGGRGTITIASGADTDQLILSHDFDSASYTVSRDVSSGNVTITFASVGTTIVLQGYLAEGQVHDGVLIGDVIYFANGVEWDPSSILGLTAPQGTSAADTLNGTFVGDSINGANGNDLILGLAGDDILIGGNGADTLIGGAGDDTIVGGASTDVLGQSGSPTSDNAGADLYSITAGGGQDAIYDFFDGGQVFDHFDEHGIAVYVTAGGNVLDLTDTAAANVLLSRSGNDLTVSFVGRSGDSVVIHGEFSNQAISTFLLAGGVTWNYAQIAHHTILQQASSGNDTITGTSASETIAGGKGNDVLQGSPSTSGNADTFIYAAGDGADTITANSVNSHDILQLIDINSTDMTVSRVGNSALLAFAGGGSITLQNQFNSSGLSNIEEIQFGNGVVWTERDILLAAEAPLTTPTITGTSASQTISGTIYRDGIDGAGGNDTLQGGLGSDTYFFGPGSGNDVIDEAGSYGSADVDTVRLNSIASNVRVSRVGQDVILKLIASGESLTLKNFFYSGGNTHNDLQSVENIMFSDGSTWNVADVTSRAWFRGTTGADSITGTNAADTIVGQIGNDTLVGGSGDDTYVIHSGDGTDIIVESEYGGIDGYNDRVQFDDATLSDFIVNRFVDAFNDIDQLTLVRADGSGSVQVGTKGGIEFFQFADGTIKSLAEILTLAEFRGTALAETLEGSQSDDIIVGGKGNDELWGAGGTDKYIWSRGDGDDRILDYENSSDSLFLTDVDPSSVKLVRVPAADTFNGQLYDLEVQVLPLLTGETVHVITIGGQFATSPTTNNGISQIIFSDGTVWSLSDIISKAALVGTTASDDLIGSGYGESIQGGLSADTLEGGAGDDTYVWASGDGNDTIIENGPSYDHDVLQFSNVASNGVDLYRAGNNVVISILATGEAITLKDALLGQAHGVEGIAFADGVKWTLGDIQAHTKFVGTSGSDYLAGDGSANPIYAGGGNDELVGGGGNDQLYGEAGFDQADFSGSRATHVFVRQSDGSVVVTDTTGTDGVDKLISIEEVYFAGDNVWYTLDSLAGAYGTTGNDAWIGGTSANDHLYGLAGADTLAGVAGNDTLDGGDGSDLASLQGNSANYTFVRNFDGSVTVTDHVGSDGVDQLINIEAVYFSSQGLWQSMDQVVGQYGTSGNDPWIAGTAHADNLYGLQGDDTFFGQGGNDTVDGGPGSDTAAFAGNLTDYTFLRNEDGSVTATDHVNGEGVDLLINMEGVYFVAASTWRSIDQVAGQYGTLGNDASIAGTLNADRLYGRDGDDVIFGNQGNDTLYGGNGDDVLKGGAGADLLSGDGGTDTADYSASTAGITINLVTGTNAGGDAAGDTLSGIEKFIGSDFNDSFIGDASANKFTGGLGNDTFVGGAGADTLSGGSGTDKADYSSSAVAMTIKLAGTGAGGDAAGDFLASIEWVVGGAGNDTLVGSSVSDTLDGGAGNNTVDYSGAGAAVTVDLGAGTGSIAGSGFTDTLIHIQNVIGTSGNDSITGDDLPNWLSGGGGSDTLTGGLAGDTLVGGAGADSLVGGGSLDIADYSGSAAAITVDLKLNTASGGDAAGDTFTSVEGVRGSSLGDSITGGNPAENIDGGGGADTIKGGSGADTLTGSGGQDVFSYSKTTDSAVGSSDLITDLSDTADHIDLSAIDANTSVSGDQAFTVVSAFTHSAGQAILSYNSTTGLTSLSLDVDGDAVADMVVTMTGDHHSFAGFVL